jgi:hypothetical protein
MASSKQNHFFMCSHPPSDAPFQRANIWHYSNSAVSPATLAMSTWLLDPMSERWPGSIACGIGADV